MIRIEAPSHIGRSDLETTFKNPRSIHNISMKKMKNEKLYYFAHPYSGKTPREERRNFENCCILAAKLMAAGYNIYAPVCHTHPIHDAGPQPWESWLALDKLFVDRCDALILAPGWMYSEGCVLERGWFKEQEKEILEYKEIMKDEP